MDQPVRPFTSITVFGGANIDRIARTAAPALPGASNPGQAWSAPGGVGFNVAVLLARLGHRVRLVARVGRDTAGERIIATAREAGVDTAAVGPSPHLATATYQAALDSNGGLLVGIADMAVTDEITPAVASAALASAPADDLFVVDANLPADTLDHIIADSETAARAVVALPVSSAKCIRLIPLLDRISVLFANRMEAAALLDTDEAKTTTTRLAEALHQRSRAHVVVTDADRALAATSGGATRTFEPFPCLPKSVNGAGDALAAGTIHGLSEGRPLFAALPFGLAAAAMTVEDEATIPAQMTAAMLKDRMRSAEIAT